MKTMHNWLCADNGIYLMRVSYATRDTCSNCKGVSSVRRCSNGNFYCDSCSQNLVLENKARWF